MEVTDKPHSPVRVFCSYAREDAEYRDELVKHMSPFVRGGQIDLWHDREIRPGNSWANEISDNLDGAEIIVLLVSADFLASRYCYEIEMEQALVMHHSGQATVIPILVRSVHWESMPLSFLQALPDQARPIDQWESQDAAWTDVISGISDAIDELKSKRTQGASPASLGQTPEPVEVETVKAGGAVKQVRKDPSPQSTGKRTPFHVSDTANFKYALLVEYGQQKGEHFMLPEGASLLVGRDERCQIRLHDGDSTASRRHARIEVRDGQLYVTDLDSKNGTYVGDGNVQHREVELNERIHCGETVICVERAPDPDRTLTQFSQRKTHVILKDPAIEEAVVYPSLLNTVSAGVKRLFGS